MTYRIRVKLLSSRIPPALVDLTLKRKRGTAPTQAFSDFITHSEQGDWAELLFFNALKGSRIPYIPVRYGRSDKIIAGDPMFKQFYNSYQDELDSIGKRPDILLFKKSDYQSSWGENISQLTSDELNLIVPKAVAGFEIRSSAYLAKKFIPKKEKSSLSFTPKVEDLLVVLKWIKTFGVPHYYVQVFFDSIYIISFEEILLLLKKAKFLTKGVINKKLIGFIKEQKVFEIEKNPHNQFKETIHIYLNHGHILSTKIIEPTLIGNRKELAGGRLLHHVSFSGGKTKINSSVLLKLIEKVY